MKNILNAILNIINRSVRTSTYHQSSYNNRINAVGSALEEYMKDAFSDTFDEVDINTKNKIYNHNFSWLGNQNNPPDFILRGGDAIEVKKINSLNADLALNSSYPKAMLYSEDPMITVGCRDCEVWDVKDLIYCIGSIKDTTLRSLWMIYGSIYAADKSVYERIKNTIINGINSIPDVEFGETKELGRVNRVDPLGITNLRIRGMWSIQNPRKVFDYIVDDNEDAEFELVSIIPTVKYLNFDSADRKKIEDIDISGFSITDTLVRDPNNPANMIESKLIKYLI